MRRNGSRQLTQGGIYWPGQTGKERGPDILNSHAMVVDVKGVGPAAARGVGSLHAQSFSVNLLSCNHCLLCANVALNRIGLRGSLYFKDDLFCCPTCGRILFYEKPEEEEKPPKKTRAKKSTTANIAIATNKKVIVTGLTRVFITIYSYPLFNSM